MTAVVQATCPGCKRVLRLPADWVNQPLRCKHCGATVQAKANAVTPLPSSRPISKSIPASKADAPKKAAEERQVRVGEPIVSRAASQVQKEPVGLPDFSELTDLDSEPLRTRTSHRPRRRFRAGALIVSLLALIGAGIAIPVAIHYHGKQADKDVAGVGGGEGGSTKPSEKSAGLIYPRRVLIVSVNNYLYANPVNHGVAAKGKSPLLDRLKSGLHISNNQIAELSDAAPGAASKPPLKPVIESNVSRFLAECRPQDRALLFFIGHAVELEGQAYLVPIEGEVDNKDTLIPLTWIYQQLEKCPACQKVLVIDVSRLNPARGLERPGSEKLTAKVDELLQNPPSGVQVWSACGKDQYSYEFEDGTMNDGLFAHSIQKVLTRGLGGVIQNQRDELPVAALQKEVNRTMKEELDAFGLAQSSRVSGQPTSGGAEDSEEGHAALPISVELPNAIGEGAATRGQVATILKEIEVPPIKAAQEDMVLKFEALPPFPAKVLEEYGAVKGTSDLREAVEKARALLQKLNTSPEMRLQEEFRAPAEETTFKKEMTEKGKGVARLIARLQGILDELKSPEIVALRKKEPKRWQANYDYILARVEAQIAYLFEYSSMLGKLKTALPPRDPAIHNGWRLASQSDLEGDRTGQSLAKDANKLLDKIIKNNPSTPWAVVAKRDKMTNLGLKFVPTK